ncbi:MAG: nuclear transport factor 2 family protein [Acidimicrobiales bacterium]
MTPEDLVELEAIKRLKYTYIRCVDLKDWEQLESTLTEDASAAYAGGALSFDGREAIMAFLRSSLSDTEIISSHRVHHPEIELTGPDTATATWALDDVVIARAAGVTIRGAAYYTDEMVKVDGQWKIRSTGYKRVYEETETRSPGLQLSATWWDPPAT